MEDLQKLLPGFPGVNPQAPFLQVAPNMNFMHNLLPMQNLQPAGQLEYKVPGNGRGLAPKDVPLSFLWETLRDCPQDLRVSL